MQLLPRCFTAKMLVYLHSATIALLPFRVNGGRGEKKSWYYGLLPGQDLYSGQVFLAHVSFSVYVCHFLAHMM